MTETPDSDYPRYEAAAEEIFGTRYTTYVGIARRFRHHHEDALDLHARAGHETASLASREMVGSLEATFTFIAHCRAIDSWRRDENDPLGGLRGRSPDDDDRVGGWDAISIPASGSGEAADVDAAIDGDAMRQALADLAKSVLSDAELTVFALGLTSNFTAPESVFRVLGADTKEKRHRVSVMSDKARSKVATAIRRRVEEDLARGTLSPITRAFREFFE